MKAPDPIEVALSRLMPAALSDEGQRSIEAMLDELAAEDGPPEIVGESATVPRRWRWLAPTGAAAAAVVLASFVTDSSRNGAVADLPASFSGADIVLIGESDRVEDMSDEGWATNADGSVMKAVRVRVIEESSLRDERTGIIVQVTQPREEMVLTPISAF
jgi:hypothetical protein